LSLRGKDTCGECQQFFELFLNGFWTLLRVHPQTAGDGV
jgi:hypothetical protein